MEVLPGTAQIGSPFSQVIVEMCTDDLVLIRIFLYAKFQLAPEGVAEWSQGCCDLAANSTVSLFILYPPMEDL